MLLKNLMEDKQLNFDQPFLSVRRQAPTVTSQKRDNRRIDSYSYQVRPQIPTYKSELKSGPLRHPGAVPFIWEQSPGQPKEETRPQTRNSDKPPIVPMLPPGRYSKAKQQDPYSVDVPFTSENKKQDIGVSCDSRTDQSNDENVKNVERSKVAPKGEEESSDSGDSEEAYVDARSTLSRTEYSFLNCSVSGLSGVEDLDAKPSRRFSEDPQAREFMMDRFLPAAKAMASETPHAPKKQPLQVQAKQPKKTANQCKPSLRYGPSFAKKYSHYNESEEEEESDDEYDQRANLTSVCGLLPRFCLKSSLGLLSPVPAMSVRTRVPASSANRVRPRSTSSGSYSEMENESRSDRTEIKSIDNNQAAELDEDKAKLKSESGRLESQKEVLSFREETMRVEQHSNGLKTFQEFLHDRGSPYQLNSEDPVVEKPLYVDTVRKVESPSSRPFSPSTQGSEIASKPLQEDAVKIWRTEQMNAVDSHSPHQDLKKLHTVDGDAPNAHKFGDSDISRLIAFGEQALKLHSANEDLEVSEKKLQSELPAPPPLPKSPSDSWLGRTLPSMTTKNSSLRPYLAAAATPENYFSKAPTSDMKWETIVKTTKVERRHMHYSEESLTTIPEV